MFFLDAANIQNIPQLSFALKSSYSSRLCAGSRAWTPMVPPAPFPGSPGSPCMLPEVKCLETNALCATRFATATIAESNVATANFPKANFLKQNALCETRFPKPKCARQKGAKANVC